MSYLIQLLVLFCVSCTSHVSGSKQEKFEFVEEWNAWKGYHGKSYQSDKEEIEKHIVWLSNKEYVDQHNANAHIFGFKLDLNHLGDMVSSCLPCLWTYEHTLWQQAATQIYSFLQTDLEYLDMFNSYHNVPDKNRTQSKVFIADPLQSYPEAIDWRTKGAVTGIKNQVCEIIKLSDPN